MDSPLASPSTPRRKRIIDRFIPHREGSDLGLKFSATSSARQPVLDDANEDYTDVKVKENKEAREMYSTLLQTELFGGSLKGDFARRGNDHLSMPHSSSMGNIATTHADDTSGSMSPDRSFGSLSTHSANSLNLTSPSHSSLSLPNSPRKRKDTENLASSMMRFSPRKLIRSESDLSDISRGGGGFGLNLRPESRDYLLQPKRQQRVIRPTPYKVLDAPEMKDDFYLNLVDWAPSEFLAVGLGSKVYIHDPRTGVTNMLADLKEGDSVASVSWMENGDALAVGTEHGLVHLYSAETCKRLRTMGGHYDRASCLSWNESVLSSGSRDTTILHRDCRVKESFLARFEGHRGEVCGLKWNTDTQQLASGSNDNKLKIWSGISNKSVASQDPVYTFDEHTSAVKGLAWSPYQRGLLASGGGFCDRKIWFWNTTTGKSVSSIETGSQVCNLAWSPRAKELISTHGNRYNDIVVWKYPTMQPITRLRAHAHRVLYMAPSSDGNYLATGAGDETLRLWSLFDDEDQDQDTSVVDLYKQLR